MNKIYNEKYGYSHQIYVYEISYDGETILKEIDGKLDYKATIRNLYAQGHTEVWIKFLHTYYI